MEKVILRNWTHDDKPLEAIFTPSRGMNLISFRKGDIEAIDQSTWPLFEERYAGLGALIGPHFHQREQGNIPFLDNANLFPHVQKEKERGRIDPFSHGIARYAPWRFSASENSISAVLRGNDVWNGAFLKDIEGMDFEMHFEARLSSDFLSINFSVESDRPSVVGLHYYYAMTPQSRVKAEIGSIYRDEGKWKPIPHRWLTEKGNLNFDLNESADFGFLPLKHDYSDVIFLETKTHSLEVFYQADNEETSWQLWHPKDKTFVCIEPLSAKNPNKPIQKSSSITVEIGFV